MLAIKMRRLPIRQEELRRVGIFALVSHAHDSAAVVRQRAFELVSERFPPTTLAAAARARGIAALQHEISDVAVEGNVIVSALFGESDEVPDCFGGEFGVEGEVYAAVGCAQAGVAGVLDAFGFQHVLFVAENGAVVGGDRGDAS